MDKSLIKAIKIKYTDMDRVKLWVNFRFSRIVDTIKMFADGTYSHFYMINFDSLKKLKTLIRPANFNILRDLYMEQFKDHYKSCDEHHCYDIFLVMIGPDKPLDILKEKNEHDIVIFTQSS